VYGSEIKVKVWTVNFMFVLGPSIERAHAVELDCLSSRDMQYFYCWQALTHFCRQLRQKSLMAGLMIALILLFWESIRIKRLHPAELWVT
jgi:hypothetical protein